MAVIPGGSHPVPDGAKQSGADLALIQNLTDADVRNQIKSQALLPWQSAHGSFFTNIIGGIGKALLAGVSGAANLIGDWASSFFNMGRKAAYGTEDPTDGQLSLADRADLLAPLLNYGSVFCPVSGANGRAVTGLGPVPFTEMIGYRRNVELASGGGLKLGEKGTWNYYLHMTSGFLSYSYAGNDNGWYVPYLELIVLRPDGSEFSRETVAASINFKSSSAVVGGGASWYQTSNVLSGTVQVPDPDYVVKVEIRGGSNRLPWLGGPRWSRLTVQNISSDFFEDSATGGEVSSSEDIQG